MTSNTPEKLKQIIAERSYPEPNTGCWLWGWSVNFFGYGILKARQLNPKIVTAHRASYWLFNGEFDLTLSVLHKCDTPCCVNPSHLFLGTQLDNIRDRDNKGRSNGGSLPGSRCAKSKLKENDVTEIRQSNLNQYELAIKYNVTQANISCIQSRKTWRHI